MRNACFGLSRHPILTSKIHPKIIFVSRHLPAHPFFNFYADLLEKWSIWGPLQNPVGAKLGPKTDQAAPTCQQIHVFSTGGAFCSRPVFHETILIIVPFGPSGFVKSHSFDGDWLILCLFCFCTCYVLFNIVSMCFHTTTVNVGPLSLPIFEKIVPHFEK